MESIKDKVKRRVADFLNELEGEVGTLPKFAHNLKDDNEKIYYSGPLFDKDELSAAIESLVAGKWLATGECVARFEKKFSKHIDTKYSVMVNSGSSANLVMVGAAKKFFKWEDGDEIIVSPVGFPTTIAPIVQHNLKPVFIDIEFDSLNFNLDLLEKNITSKTKAIFVSPVLGNPPDMDKIVSIAEKYQLRIIMDGCDSLGTKWDDKELNLYSDVTSCSFYPAHHITTGEGGMVSSNYKELIDIARSMAWWGRDCYCIGTANLLPCGTCSKRFDKWLDNVEVEIDHKYVFTNIGYNLKPLDLQGNIGLEQLKKIDKVHSLRREYKKVIQEFFNKIPGIKEAKTCDKANPSWFGVPIICDNAELKQRLVKYLEDNNIQTRTYFAGNILLHPGYKHLDDYKKYPLSNEVLSRVFFVGCSPTYNDQHIKYIEKVVGDFK